jgi:isopentenyl diphosphate isomerase/L-lactate dehydrogenase-like FMN-dependent dehydrogenase
MGGMAGPFLKAATQSTEAVIRLIEEIREEIRITMFGVGAANLSALSQTPLIEY